jgi:hypothetical protein
MRDYPKRIQKLLRQCMSEAYERELRRELTQLDGHFAAWRTGRITSGELSHYIHQFETGPARELFNQYNQTPPDLAVAYALVAGILQREAVPAELLAAIERPLSSYQALKERNELTEPGARG